MGVDYEQQLKDNAAAQETELKNSNAAYDKTINDYQAVVDSKQQQLDAFKEEQSRLQQEQTDFAIEKIEQEREQTEKDYTKEQQAAYGDYKRQTDPYGVNAEQMAALGLSRSGYSESSNVAMYTAYQNRVATARASFEQAKQTFDNAIREAKLTNDINLAQIAQQALEQSLALSMESVVQLGNLELQKAAAASSIEEKYYNREQDIHAAQQAEQERIWQEQQAEIERQWKSTEAALDRKFQEDQAAIEREFKEAQQAEIAAAKQDQILDEYRINPDDNPGGNGEPDFSAVERFFGDSMQPDELEKAAADLIDAGIITAETVNGVDVYKVADGKKALEKLTEIAKEDYEAALQNLRALREKQSKGNYITLTELRTAEDKVRSAKRDFDIAHARFMSYESSKKQ